MLECVDGTVPMLYACWRVYLLCVYVCMLHECTNYIISDFIHRHLMKNQRLYLSSLEEKPVTIWHHLLFARRNVSILSEPLRHRDPVRRRTYLE